MVIENQRGDKQPEAQDPQVNRESDDGVDDFLRDLDAMEFRAWKRSMNGRIGTVFTDKPKPGQE